MRWLQGWWPSIAWDGIATSWDLAEGTPPLISTWWRAGLGFFWAQKKLGIIQDLWEFRVIFLGNLWGFIGIYGSLKEGTWGFNNWNNWISRYCFSFVNHGSPRREIHCLAASWNLSACAASNAQTVWQVIGQTKRARRRVGCLWFVDILWYKIHHKDIMEGI